MKRLSYFAIIPIALGAAMLTLPQQAEAACTGITATANGIARITVTERAEAKLNRAIDRYAREGKTESVRVRNRGTSCTTTQIATQNCTAAAYVCR